MAHVSLWSVAEYRTDEVLRGIQARAGATIQGYCDVQGRANHASPGALERWGVSELRRMGVRALDALIVTHLDEDHLGGAVPILQALSVKRFLTNGAENATMTFRPPHLSST